MNIDKGKQKESIVQDKENKQPGESTMNITITNKSHSILFTTIL